MGAACPDCLCLQKAIHLLLHLKRKTLGLKNYARLTVSIENQETYFVA